MTISAHNLTVNYGSTTILHSLSFGPLGHGKVVGLIGPNAAGKSTLVKTIAGIKRPSGGTVTVTAGGRELLGKQRVEALGYVPQDLLSTPPRSCTGWASRISRTDSCPTCPVASDSSSPLRRC